VKNKIGQELNLTQSAIVIEKYKPKNVCYFALKSSIEDLQYLL